MKQAFPAVALLALLLGLFVEQSLWGETMAKNNGELTEWNSAEWHFRGWCEDCHGYKVLARTSTGDLCEACDLEHVVQAQMSDAGGRV